MQKILSTLLIFTAAITAAQTENRCGFLQAQEYLFSQDPTAEKRTRELMDAAAEQSQQYARPASTINYTIPVVFHVLHLNGSENISDAQIIDQVAILNRDFTKKNADTINAVSQFQNLIGNPGIEFRLATLDPNGNCTTGITRHYDTNTDWTVNFSNYIYTWDRTKYLNIYVVRTMPAGSAAYSYYPGTVGPNADAVVVQSIYVGSIGTSQPYVSRIVTHEVGHWLNLQHPWGSTNNPGVACGDDGVLDTPVTEGYTSCNLGNTINCTPGITENIQNYMDYAYCQIMFTPGQCSRMLTALNSPIASRNNLWSANNLQATGITNPFFGCPPKAQFLFTNSLTCVGGTANFTDQSYNAPVTSWQWSSPEASNTSTLQNGVLTFTASGLASVKLKVSNAFGSDSIIKQKLIVLTSSGNGNVNVNQGFEAIVFPDNDWQASQPLAGSGFQQTTGGALNGNNSVWVDNYDNMPSEPVSFYSPPFNLQTTASSALTFYYAYVQQNSSDNEMLRVSGSSDCGQTWVSLWAKNASALNSNGGFMNSVPYLNPGQSDWVQVNINTNSYFAGQPKVYFKFEFSPDHQSPGNNIYIDDINLSGVSTTGFGASPGLSSDVVVSPNPFSDKLLLSGRGLEKISSYELRDISGRLLLMGSDLQVKQNVTELCGLSELCKGVYFISLNSPEGSKVFKAVKE